MQKTLETVFSNARDELKAALANHNDTSSRLGKINSFLQTNGTFVRDTEFPDVIRFDASDCSRWDIQMVFPVGFNLLASLHGLSDSGRATLDACMNNVLMYGMTAYRLENGLEDSLETILTAQNQELKTKNRNLEKDMDWLIGFCWSGTTSCPPETQACIKMNCTGNDRLKCWRRAARNAREN